MKERYLNWRYLGLPRETLETFADRVFFDNLRILYAESIVLGILTLASSVVLMMSKYDIVKTIVLLCTSFFSFVIAFVSHDFKKNGAYKITGSVSTLLFIFELGLYLFVSFIGTYQTTNYGALMVGAVVITQVSFDTRPYKNLRTLLVGNLIYFVSGFIFKDHSVLAMDFLNIFTSSVMGMIISWKKAKAKWEHEEAIELIERNNSLLYTSSLTDPLTGLLNRRTAFDKLEVMAAQSSVSGKEIVCVIMDLDNFKKFNDTYGHPEGDKLLEALGKILQKIGEKYSLTISRIGGEEFMAFWNSDGKISPRYVTEEIRASVKQIEHPESDKGLFSTISVGVYANVAAVDDTASKIYSKADRAVYEAKRNGRDRVEFYDNSIEE